LPEVFRALLRVLGAFLILFPGLLATFLIMRAFLRGNTAHFDFAVGLMIIFLPTLLIKMPGYTPPKRPHHRKWRMLWLILPIIAIFPLSVIVLIFGTVDMAAYVFHLFYGIGGTPWGDLMPYILTAATFWMVFVVTVYRFQSWLERIPHTTAILGLGVIALNPLVHELAFGRAKILISPHESLLSTFSNPVLLDGVAQPNVVILYLEGFESTYAEPVFGDAYAPISRLAENAISFTNVAQATATGWSLAGTIATQCGTPLLLGGVTRIQDIDAGAAILPSVTCLSDIAQQKGYAYWYMSGTELLGEAKSYYGYGNFFDTHGGANVRDRSALTEALGQEIVFDESQGWGFRDAILLDAALERFAMLLAEERPFILNVAAMDTHGPKAFLSEACRGPDGALTSENMLDAVQCTARLVETFVAEMRKMSRADETRIIVMSDHLAHHNNLSGSLANFERRNTVLFLDDPAGGQTIDRPSTMLDVFPTMLDWLGWIDPAAPEGGLGVSLLSDGTRSLPEDLGHAALNERLKLDVELARHIWRQQ